MTLDGLLDRARRHIAECRQPPDDDNDGGCTARTLARGIVDLLGEDKPCGYPEPIVRDGLLTVGANRVTPTEMRALCAMWLRACDEAEGAP